MFTGIIESVGSIINVEKEKSNLHLTISSSISNELKIDQSVSHNGVCLTVIQCDDKTHKVTAIEETLRTTNLASIKVGNLINLERCLMVNGRLDGHIVQGHVDQTGTCVEINEKNGSWIYTITYEPKYKNITVEKGSICINGVSLTVLDSRTDQFSVAIIPYTYEQTNFKHIKSGDKVNLEFDILGKYVTKLLTNYKVN